MTLKRFDVWSTTISAYSYIFLLGVATGNILHRPTLTPRVFQDEIYQKSSLDSTIENGLRITPYSAIDSVNFE